MDNTEKMKVGRGERSVHQTKDSRIEESSHVGETVAPAFAVFLQNVKLQIQWRILGRDFLSPTVSCCPRNFLPKKKTQQSKKLKKKKN